MFAFWSDLPGTSNVLNREHSRLPKPAVCGDDVVADHAGERYHGLIMGYNRGPTVVP